MKHTLIILFALFGFSLNGLPHLVLIGPAGAGKGTLSQQLMKKYDYVHICPGDMIRDEIYRNTTLGQKIKDIVNRGDYIEDHIVFGMIKSAFLDALKNNKPVIIDGYPRTQIAYNRLHEFTQKNNLTDNIRYIHFIVDDNTLAQRISNRRICKECHHVYNNASHPPQQEGWCDLCNVPLVQRDNDTKDIVIKRLNFYRNNIESIVKIVDQSYETIALDASLTPDQCVNRLTKIIE